MSLEECGIQYKKLAGCLIASIRFNLINREETPIVVNELFQLIPNGNIAGQAFCIIQGFSSYQEGYEVEVGVPVSEPVDTGRVKSRVFPDIEVLSLVHRGPIEKLRESKVKLRDYALEHGLCSEEFSREVYPDWKHLENGIEVQFVLHDWCGLLTRNINHTLGEEAGKAIWQGYQGIGIETRLEERFQWVKGALEKLEGIAGEFQKYDAISRCAHIFPGGMVNRLADIYQRAREETQDSLNAVDAVIEFIRNDPGWGEKSLYRDGHVIYTSKLPADPEGYKQAKTVAEKRTAYCYCPLVRTNLERGMPATFCYCGAGWFRQQWETATGKPVKVELLKTILKGDDSCQFAVHLASDL